MMVDAGDVPARQVSTCLLHEKHALVLVWLCSRVRPLRHLKHSGSVAPGNASIKGDTVCACRHGAKCECRAPPIVRPTPHARPFVPQCMRGRRLSSGVVCSIPFAGVFPQGLSVEGTLVSSRPAGRHAVACMAHEDGQV